MEICKEFEQQRCTIVLEHWMASINSGYTFSDYKKYFLMVLMVLMDNNYNLVSIDTGAHGSSADSKVFRKSRRGEENDRKIIIP